MPESELIRVYRVAKMLDVTKKRVYQMVHEGKIVAVRLGPKSMRIKRDSLEKFIRAAEIKREQNEIA